jgi:hypothetical protein
MGSSDIFDRNSLPRMEASLGMGPTAERYDGRPRFLEVTNSPVDKCRRENCDQDARSGVDMRNYLKSLYTFLIREKVGFHRPLPLSTPEERLLVKCRVDEVTEEMRRAVALLDLRLDVARRGRHQ